MPGDLRDALTSLAASVTPDTSRIAQRDVQALLDHGVTSEGDLRDVATDGDAPTLLREIALWALARLPVADARATLAAALADPNDRIRTSAAQSLALIGDSEEVDALVDALEHDEASDVRKSSAHALGLIGDSRAVSAVSRTLVDDREEPEVRGMAAEALGDLGDRSAVKPLVSALSDPAVEVRFWSAFALGRLGDPAASPALRRLAESDDGELPGRGSIREEAEAAVATIAQRSSE
jgi:HEAT repeat protein